MKYEAGTSKPMEEVTLQDMLEYPIWTFALDEEGIDGQDETWQKPILSRDVKKEYLDVYILLKIKNTDQYISGNLYTDKMTLSDIALWKNGRWLAIGDTDELEYPLYLISAPSIENIENVKFVVNNQKQKGELAIPRERKSINLFNFKENKKMKNKGSIIGTIITVACVTLAVNLLRPKVLFLIKI